MDIGIEESDAERVAYFASDDELALVCALEFV